MKVVIHRDQQMIASHGGPGSARVRPQKLNDILSRRVRGKKMTTKSIPAIPAAMPQVTSYSMVQIRMHASDLVVYRCVGDTPGKVVFGYAAGNGRKSVCMVYHD